MHKLETGKKARRGGLQTGYTRDLRKNRLHSAFITEPGALLCPTAILSVEFEDAQ
jgi:hypothetical protein